MEWKDLLTQPVLWWSLLFSTAVFVGSLLAIPWMITRLPPDYFDHERRMAARPPVEQRWLYYLFLVVKNLAGCIFLVAGLAMLVLPGQGILTVLIGISLINFPGKYRLERYLVSRRWVLRPLNWLRRRKGQPPFDIHPHDHDEPMQ
jgi:hypothetical protein